MAGRFPHGLDKDSGSQSPASASSPISYRTNVNRQKTKKWAEAKPADYGGDDWGDEDEFEPPPPVPKPTGLRQQGQALNNALPKLDTPSTAAKKDYGDLPPVPNSAPASRPRVNSFDADDEKRNFSSGLARQPSPQPTSATAPPTRFSQITGVPSMRSPMTHPALSVSTQASSQPPVTGLRKAMETPPPSGPAAPDMNPLGRTSTGASSVASSTVTSGPPGDYQTRRDFSSSAQPPTLQTGASPEPPVIRVPGQNGGPTKVPEETGSTQSGAIAQPTSPSSAAAAQSKALPFIRPADIYRRRMEEERERQSLDSNRSSVDALPGAKPTDRSESPAHVKQAFDAPSKQRAGSEAEDTFDPGRLRSQLEPVRERKSEYGFDGFQLNDPSGSDLLDSPDYSAHDKLGAAIERRQSTSPQLPNLNRMSGFGMDFLSQSKSEEAAQPTSQPPATASIPSTKTATGDAEEHPLRPEPSLGFKSAVDQAFDRSDEGNEPSLPPTPASRTNTSIQRTESESTGTAGISPIMSRLPSTATQASRNQDVSIDSVAEPDPLPTVKESTEAQGPSEPVSGAAAFKPGHRRDISTPTPGNSPARTPDVTTSPVVSDSQQAVLSETAPTSGGETVPFGLQTESEQSIRPSLQTSSEDILGPERYVSPSEERNEKFDINPTTTKPAHPHSSSEAAVLGASLGAVAGVAAGEHNKSASEAAKSDNVATEDGSPSLAPKDGSVGPTATSQAPPLVTTDSTSIDEQNDKLHKDIVKRLSIPLNSTAQDGLLAPDNADEQDNYDQTRISSYLPSEYENYWAASAEEETPEPLAPSLPKEKANEVATSQASPAVASDSVADNEPKPIQPLSPRKFDQTASSLVSPISRRYSWEASPDAGPALSGGQNDAQSPHDVAQADRDVRQSVDSDQKQPGSAVHEREYHAEDVALAAGGLALAGAFGAAAQHADSESRAGQRVSSVDENGSAASPNPALLSPHDVEQHDGSSQSQLSHTVDRLSSHSAGGSASLPRSSQSAAGGKIPTFKEISSIESTQQRIKTFDDTRQRFAEMDSGLSNWMGRLKAQIPEHADVSTTFRGSGMSVPARAKLPGNGSGQPAYYQQYLNASSSGAPGTPAVRPGSSAPSGSQQGLSPASGGKLMSSQQVQAKGKELLHTAGIFGGKAGKAGKGLLAKGKNRLRGDKTSGSLHKLDRRSSWGLPRSSSRSNPPSRHSGEESPTAPAQRRRASTLTLDTYPAHNHRPTVSDAMSAPGNAIAPWTVLEAFPAGQSSPPPMPALPPMMKAGGPPLDDEPESPATFDRVAPAGPGQPPFNGFVPGHENHGFYYQNQLVQQPVPAPPAAHNPSPTLDVEGQTSMGNEPASRAVAQPESESVLAPSQVVEPHGNMEIEEQQPNPQTQNPQTKNQQELISSVAQQPLPMSPVNSGSGSSPKPLPLPRPEMRLTNAADKTLTVPPPTAKTRTRGNSSTSILDRPRYSYDIPRPTEQVLQSQPQTNKPHPSFYFPSLMDPPGRSHLDVSGSSSYRGEEESSRRDSKSEHSFEGLPPIRRISGIGFDFNPLDSEVSLPSANDDDAAAHGSGHVTDSVDSEGDRDHAHHDEEIDPFDALQRHSYAEDSQAEIFAAFRAAADLHEEDGGRGPQQPGGSFARLQPQTPLRQPPSRPQIPYAVSPMHSIDPLRRQREQNVPSAITGGRLDVAANGEELVRRSEDVRVPPPFPSPGNASDVTVSQQRFSMGASPSTPRAQLRSPNSAPRGEDQEERAWRNSWTPQQQPPSSAQRYPELFHRPPIPMGRGPLGADDLPPQYFHSAVPQVSAFIPRQQPTEYQIPGVGPPPSAERPGSRRSSGFFKEIGDRIRSGSRDDGKTTSRDGDYLAEKNMNYDDTDSSIVSEDGPGLKPGRNFYARASTAAGSTHESMVAHPAASRSNLPLSTQTSPSTPNDKKKGFNASITADPIPPVPPLPKPTQLTGLTVPEDGGKKKRFSGLSSMFGKSANHASKGSVSDAARERPSFEPPPQALLPKQAQILGTGAHGNHGTPPRTFLSRLTAGGEQPAHSRQDSKDLMSKLGIGVGESAPPKRDAKPQKETKPRKKSGAGLLTGIMSRRGTQQDIPEETPSIRSKTIGPPIYHPPAFLSERALNPSRSETERSPAMTQQQFAASPRPSHSADRERDRGRRMSNDRQFPPAPTPNGYTPVRGEGATPARADFDPRNPRFQQQVDPRFPKGARQPTSPLNGPQLYPNSQQSSQDFSQSQGSRSPNLTIESSESSQRRELRRLSREDIIARSPARSPEDQQRPYRLALPDNDDSGLPHPAPMTNEVPIISPPRKNRTSAIPLSQPETAQVAIIQRLIHPALRDSPPSGRPLSDDDVFSSNSSEKNDVERGNSKAQIVLGLSPRVSNKPGRDEDGMSPRVPNKTGREEEVLSPPLSNKSNKSLRDEEGTTPRAPSKTLREEEVLAPVDALQKEMGGRLDFTPSPSPPSVGTPISRQGKREPEPSREPINKPAEREGMRIPIPEPKPSPDLYNASPRLPKLATPAISHTDDDSVGKDDKEVTEGGAGGRSSTHIAELDDPESEMLKRARGKGEEKIPAEEGLLDVDNEPVTMSATSYPGQEWNPYADGYYEDFD